MMRSQRAGARTTRRIEGDPWRSRKRATTPLAAIIRFSISDLARLGNSGWSPRSVSPSNRTRVSAMSKSSAPSSVRRLASDCAARSCNSSWSRIPGAWASGGKGPRPARNASMSSVHEMRVILHARAVHVIGLDRTVGSDDVLDDKCKAIDVRVERGEVGRQARRQHGKDDCGRVDRRRVHRGMPVDRRAFRRGHVHVGDCHEHADTVAGQRLGDRQLIEIARVVVIDRTPLPILEIAHRLGRCGWRIAKRSGLCDRIRRKVRLEAAFAHRGSRECSEALVLRRRRGHPFSLSRASLVRDFEVTEC